MIERRFIMKDGRTARIRPVRETDAWGLHACYLAVARAGLGTVRTAEELERVSDEQVLKRTMQWVDGPLSARRGCMLVAHIEGTPDGLIAGEGSIRRHPQSRLRHVAHIGLGVTPTFQGQGLGRALMMGLLAWARELPGGAVRRIDLNVLANNHRAIALYESLGFKVEGVRRKLIRYEDGTFVDDVGMALLL